MFINLQQLETALRTTKNYVDDIQDRVTDIEQYIESAPDILHVIATPDESAEVTDPNKIPLVLNKTIEEIADAYSNSKPIVIWAGSTPLFLLSTMSSQGSIVYYLFARFKDVLQYSYESFNITIDLENEPHIYATFGNGILTSPIHISLTMSNGKLVVNNGISYDDLVNHYVDYNTLFYVTYDGEYYYPKTEYSYYYKKPLVFERYNAETSVRKTITFSTDPQDADNPWTYAEETIESSGNPDWNASSSEPGYIANKPSISAGTGSHSISEGYGTMAYYMYAHAEGYKTRASNHSSHAEGCYSVATGRDSHAEGTTVNSTDYIYLTGDANATTYTISQPITDNYVRGYLLSAGGFIYADNANYKVLNVASNLSTITLDRSLSSQAISNKQVCVILSSVASGQGSHAEGLSAATGAKSHSEGNMTIAEGAASHAEGHGSEASGVNSHAEGFSQASQENAHAEGNSQATGYCSHSEGKWTTASGGSSHAEGIESVASKDASHAEGQNTVASGLRAHAEGAQSTASGDESHAEGARTVASGTYSHAEGFGTTANHQAQHVFGIYNIPDANVANANAKGDYIEIVGNGAHQTPSNARTLDWSGNEWLSGNIKIGGTSYDDANAKEIATKDYVDETIANSVLSDAIITVSGTKLSITTNNT